MEELVLTGKSFNNHQETNEKLFKQLKEHDLIITSNFVGQNHLKQN